ncbi:hypothetical protein EVAR_92834_1 [Eumeta japonica]|uniref:Uncharacterized protein n=1 Tax=Eumeta variegata TaxID=151549 RepID=A0A4C1TAX1_EUMVA|nr:hypothetical protein EVAR_92834_1 [Eumeta japonica]
MSHSTGSESTIKSLFCDCLTTSTAGGAEARVINDNKVESRGTSDSLATDATIIESYPTNVNQRSCTIDKVVSGHTCLVCLKDNPPQSLTRTRTVARLRIKHPTFDMCENTSADGLVVEIGAFRLQSVTFEFWQIG